MAVDTGLGSSCRELVRIGVAAPVGEHLHLADGDDRDDRRGRRTVTTSMISSASGRMTPFGMRIIGAATIDSAS